MAAAPNAAGTFPPKVIFASAQQIRGGAMSKESKGRDRWSQVFSASHGRPANWCKGCGYYRVVHGVHRADCTVDVAQAKAVAIALIVLGGNVVDDRPNPLEQAMTNTESHTALRTARYTESHTEIGSGFGDILDSLTIIRLWALACSLPTYDHSAKVISWGFPPCVVIDNACP
jgi:hypothetical protein